MSFATESPDPGGDGTAHTAGTALAVAVLLLAATYGSGLLALRVAAGTTTWAGPAALAFGALLAALLALGLARRATSFELALAALAWCFPAALVCDLFPYPTARHVGSGPSVAPVYFAVALASGLFALGRLPRVTAMPAATRACLLIAFWSTADGRLFQRDGQGAILLLAAAALMTLAVHGRGRLLELWDSRGQPLLVLPALLAVWWSLAAAYGDSWRMGVQATAHLVSGIALAAALATALDARDARRCVGGLALGLVVSCALLVFALIEMLPYNDLARILGSRLRLFDTHPNQIAPLFAAGACLLAPLVLRPSGQPSAVGLPRWLLAVTALGLVAALAWTHSRGSIVACAIGLAVALAGARGALPRRPLRAVVPLAALGLGAAVMLASPFAAGLRAKLLASTLVASAVGQRFHLWRSATAAIADHPWFGLGPTQYYAHSRYAEPSFYDGTNQGTHPHSILLAAGESAGIPGLLIFVALVLGLLELGRRRVLAADDPGERRIWSGLLGAVCAVLAADLFDLSQGGPTLVPLLLWVALGLFGAGPARRASGAGHPRLAMCALAGALLLPLTALPMAGKLGSVYGRNLLARGQAWSAMRVYQALAVVHPWNRDAPASLITARLMLDQRARALEELEAQCHAAPNRVSRWMRYGDLLLAEDRAAEALAAFERAEAADPRGSLTGALSLARARALVALGREVEARALLLDGLIQSGSEWSAVPAEIPLTEVLDELGQRGLALARSDEVLARRLIGRVAEGHRVTGDPATGLEFVRTYSALVEPMASIQVLEVQLLCQLGDYEGAAAAYHASPHAAHPFMTAAYLRGIGPSVGTPREREYLELPLDLRGTGNMDPFFAAELSANVFDVEAHRALARGDEAAARRYLRRALYHLVQARPRLDVATRYFERAAELGSSHEALAHAFAVLLEEASRVPATAGDEALLKGWAARLREAWDGPLDALPPEIDRALARAGALGEAFRAVW